MANLRTRKYLKINRAVTFKFDDCYAKTFKDKSGNKVLGRNVISHCLIVGLIARKLISRFHPSIQSKFFVQGSEMTASAHDIGKVCPTFQEKIRRGCSNYVANSSHGLENVDPEMEKQWGGHACLSELTAKAVNAGRYNPEILGQHHGYSPQICGRTAFDEVFGGESWQSEREKLIQELKAQLNCDWPKIETTLQAKLIAGLTTVSDWIGSGRLFDDPTNQNWQQDIELALNDAGFLKPEIKPNLAFEQIFGFMPRGLQYQFIESCNGPGVYILEAPMGIGKTEAALYLAYKLMSSGEASGLYFALPTQLTSDKIYERVNHFLNQILHPLSMNTKALLLHSNAWLKITEMGGEGAPGGSWFHTGKRGILAPFGVGTIDQALMAVMNVKHGFVRALGLVGKVVILDEVHSYDSYTGTIIDNLIDVLRELNCTIIILSATLTRSRRAAFLKAEPTSNEYPLITTSFQDSINEITVTNRPCSEVSLRMIEDNSLCVEEALFRAEQGQQILWIENTVAEAQERYKELAARAYDLNIPCGLLHSRFLKIDREQIENTWINHFGRNGTNNRTKSGRILVGTQVVEQSVDIDADFLISRICPTDMLLQRLGRLWRHKESYRPPKASREAWILSPKLEPALNKPLAAFGKTAKVYAPYVLLRTLEVWQQLLTISIPEQIRELIEMTYCDRNEEGNWSEYLQDLMQKRNKLASLASIGLATGICTLPESKASTRYSEEETVETLLIRERSINQQNCIVTLLNGEQILIPKIKKNQDREISIKLMQNTVRVPIYLAPQALNSEELEWLSDYLYVGNGEEGYLRVARVRPSGTIATLDDIPMGNISYSSIYGYESK